MTKASDLFISALENEGVEYVFGVPGEENLDVLDSISRSKIKLILTRHEQGAGFMAATYGRLTGKPGVCMGTLGPGAMNLVNPTAYAQLGGMPMVVLTGQKPIKVRSQGQFQVLDVVEVMTPLTKYARQIVHGDRIPAHVREAFRLAQEEKPGAVHLELPEDIARESTSRAIVEPSLSRRPIAEGKAIKAAVEAVAKAKRPILIVGCAANRTMTSKMLTALVDTFKLPFVTTQMGKGVVDEGHPMCIGNAALSSGDFVHRVIEASDVILNVGHDIVEKPPFLMSDDEMKEDKTTVIHVSFSSASVDSVYFPQIEVVGDIANSVWQIHGLLKEKKLNWDVEPALKVRRAAEAYNLEYSTDDSFPVRPERLVADVRKAVGGDGVIALDNGIYKIWFARNYKASKPNTVLLDNALATMGAGLPSAMATKLVKPDAPVVAICGDGGFMMNSQELETALRLKLHIVVLILRDDAYGMIKWKQENLGLADFGLDFGNPDFVKYAESYGAKGHRPDSANALLPLLEETLADPGVHVIDLRVDYSDNDRTLNKEIKERSQRV